MHRKSAPGVPAVTTPRHEWKIWEGRSADSLVKMPRRAIDRDYKTTDEPCLPHCRIHPSVYTCISLACVSPSEHMHVTEKGEISSAPSVTVYAVPVRLYNKRLDCDVPPLSLQSFVQRPLYIYCRPLLVYHAGKWRPSHPFPPVPSLKRLRGHLSPPH